MNSCPKCEAVYDSSVQFCPVDGSSLKKLPDDTFELEGRIIDGKYRVIEKIGSGGMGSVYKAEHAYLKNIVALKVLHQHLTGDEEYLERFQREARTACRIRHPHAITLHDFGVEDDYPYLAMDFIEGVSLKIILREEAPLPLDRIYRIASQVCGAIAEAHALGVIHRDLKPDNILVAKGKDGGDWAYVLDFGIAKLVHSEQSNDPGLTRAGTVLGSPRYMAPEQVLEQDIDTRADLYSFGAVLYRMFTGYPPFHAGSVMETMLKHVHEEPIPVKDRVSGVAISDAVNTVVMKLLKKDREERYQTIEEFLRDFTEVCEADGVTVMSQSLALPSVQPPKRRSTLRSSIYWASAVSAGVALGLYATVSLVPKIQQESLSRQLKKLEELKASREEEAKKAALLLEEKRAEAERAAKRVEEQRLTLEEVTEEAELYRAEREKEQQQAAQLRAEAEKARSVAREKEEAARRAALEAQALRAKLQSEAQKTAELVSEAERARRLAIEQQEAALKAAQEAAKQAEASKAMRELEQRRMEELKRASEETAEKVKLLEAELKQAAIDREQREKQEREEKLAAKKAREASSSDNNQVQSELEAKAEAKRVAEMKAKRIAEEKRIARMQEQLAAEERRLERLRLQNKAEEELKRKKEQEAREAAAAAARAAAEAAKEKEEQEKRRPRVTQGKRR